jgi:hypothetical protein
MDMYKGTAGSSTVSCGSVQGDPYRVFVCPADKGRASSSKVSSKGEGYSSTL